MNKKCKIVHIEFIFTAEEWTDFKKHYTDAEIRQILMEGGIGEMSNLMLSKEGYTPSGEL